jgi:hypothetical protein
MSALVAWILSLMGVDPVTTIRVGMDRVEFSSSSLAGTQSRLIPLQSVCSSYYGYHKPWKAAVGIVFFFPRSGARCRHPGPDDAAAQPPPAFAATHH